MITWERLLVIWGLLAPAIAWLATRSWDRSLQREQWEREEKRRAEEHQRSTGDRAREAKSRARADRLALMKTTYGQFLEVSGMLLFGCNLRSDAERQAVFERTFQPFARSYHELILLGSNDTVRPAAEVWRTINCLVSARGCPESWEELLEIARRFRTDFAHEARRDLEKPSRTRNPGLSIRPVLSVGGFSVPNLG